MLILVRMREIIPSHKSHDINHMVKKDVEEISRKRRRRKRNSKKEKLAGFYLTEILS